MDLLYDPARTLSPNKRLEILRNFVRFLIEHQNFVPQSPGHRIEIAEKSALKLKEIYNNQLKEMERNSFKFRVVQKEKQQRDTLESVQEAFKKVWGLTPQKRGFALEKLFPDLMRVSNVQVFESFKIEGEQIDGAIKYESHYYLVELKWTEKKIDQKEIASLYMKVEGKFECRGIMISMTGYSSEVINSLPKGKELKIILLDGIHLSNMIFGDYTFQELLDYAMKEAVLKGNIYCEPSKVLK